MVRLARGLLRGGDSHGGGIAADSPLYSRESAPLEPGQVVPAIVIPGTGWGPIMQSNFFMRTSSHPPRADNAVSKINVDYKRSHSSVPAGFIIGINF